MDGNDMTPANIAALMKNNDNDFGGNGSMWMTLFFFIIFMGMGAMANNNRQNPPVIMPNPQPAQPAVTQPELTAGLNNVQVQQQLQALQLATANNDLETVKAINQSKTELLQRDYTNNINILQGYNNVTQSINNQTYALSSQIEQLGYKMDQCCCGLQRQMLEDKNNDLQNIVNQQSTQIAINAAVQAALGQTGRYVAWEPSGSSTTTKVVAGGAAA